MPSSAKQQLQTVLQALPDDCTFEDVQDAIYLLEQLRKAEASIAHNGAVPHDEAKRRLSRWLGDQWHCRGADGP